MTMTHQEKVEFLRSLGLEVPAAQDTPAPPKAKKAKKKKAKARKVEVKVEAEVAEADDHTVAIESITLPEAVTKRRLTDVETRSAAQSELFRRYKAAPRSGDAGRNRNKALWRHLGHLLAEEARKQRTRTKNPQSTRAIKSDQSVMDLATVLKDRGITAADLIALLDEKE